jgi:2,3-bisphosphoglycerate-independent phosphoglycerate mutase
MTDYSAGEITTGEAKRIIADLAKELEEEGISFYPGVSYRHVIVWEGGPFGAILTPPHDILEKKIKQFLPKGEGCQKILSMMKESYRILRSHPVNLERDGSGQSTADSIWLWGQGKKPALDSFYEKFGLKGAVISAVDLVKGIGICAGLEPVEVKGATGNIHTDFKGKADAALDMLVAKDKDFVFIHIEAPDECGHQGKLEEKIKSIELIDEKVIKTIKDGLEHAGKDFRMMILPDHPTPIKLRTHTSDPVPYLIYDSKSKDKKKGPRTFSESEASKTGDFFDTGYGLTEYFLKG